jgi:tetratricopeptide (TPR) repeat protein
MANNQLYPIAISGWASRLLPLGRRLLLVPEAVLMIGFVGMSLALGGSPLIGTVIVLLTSVLVVRVGAIYLAQATLAAARYTEAEQIARFANFLHPWSADTLALRGVIALMIGAQEDAIWFLQRSLNLFPYAATTHAALSGALLGLGRGSAARLAAQHSLELDPSSAIAFLYLAEAERIDGIPALEVEDTLRSGLAIAYHADDIAALRCALAALLLNEDRSAEVSLALGGLDRLIEQCSPAVQSRLRFRYGELLLAHGQIDRAREYLQQTVMIDVSAHTSSSR